MKNRIGILVATALVACATLAGLKFVGLGTEPALSTDMRQGPMSRGNWVLAFSDDFSGTKLDPSKWSTCYDWRRLSDSGCTNGGNFEQEWYMPSQVSVMDGSAVLTAVYDPVTVRAPIGVKTYPYRSGMISTGRSSMDEQAKWSATYGYYEARVKFDGGQGVWPAFWLLPVDRSWPPEIDIMEFLGNDPRHVLLTSHWRDVNGNPQKDTSVIAGPDFTAGWHTYAVNWQPGRIDWYIDGALQKSATGIEVSSKPMEIILNLAIGGLLPGNANPSTPFPCTMQIDYVKVYERKQ